jgi:hypothetical protein
VKRRKLVKQVKGAGKAAAGPALVVRVWPRPAGRVYCTPDGEVAEPLGGEPPTAITNGWGRIPGQ